MKSRASTSGKRPAPRQPVPKHLAPKNADMPPLDFAMLLANARQASELLKALSHEVRLLILCFLIEGEKSVGEIEKLLDLRQPAVSQQLARLRADGLVDTRRNGKSIYYSLARSEVRDVIGVLHDAFCKPRRTR